MGKIYPGKLTAFEYIMMKLKKRGYKPHKVAQMLWTYWGADPRKERQHKETAKQMLNHMKYFRYEGGRLAEMGLALDEQFDGKVFIRQMNMLEAEQWRIFNGDK